MFASEHSNIQQQQQPKTPSSYINIAPAPDHLTRSPQIRYPVPATQIKSVIPVNNFIHKIVLQPHQKQKIQQSSVRVVTLTQSPSSSTQVVKTQTIPKQANVSSTVSVASGNKQYVVKVLNQQQPNSIKAEQTYSPEKRKYSQPKPSGNNVILANANLIKSQRINYFVPPKKQKSPSVARGSFTLSEVNSSKKKPCNCSKSNCLKLYCECFAIGELCDNCNCLNCMNDLDHDGERQRAVKLCLDRNPHAFHPKVGRTGFNSEKAHYKGCNCRKSNCLKNYCECYEARILCSTLCRCCECKNCDDSTDRRHYNDISALKSLRESIKVKPNNEKLNNEGVKLPFSLMTREVIEATCSCLLVQAEEADAQELSAVERERLILEEFGCCLSKIITSVNKVKPISSIKKSSYLQSNSH